MHNTSGVTRKMSKISIAEILTYPIKSTTASSVSSSEIGPRGLTLDRHWAIFKNDGTLVTAREYPDLLLLQPQVTPAGLDIRLNGEVVLAVPKAQDGNAEVVDVFGVGGTGVASTAAVNAWFSDFLKTPCRLIFMSDDSSRPVHADYGGQSGDTVSYADECPVMLLSQATLEELNAKLPSPLSIRQFRPNLVAAGCEPGAEDTWRMIRIGDAQLEVTKRCKRCNFATLDPTTRQMHEEQEPLRTLSTYRRHPEGGVAFGMLMIPRSFGRIRVGDEIEVIL